MGVHRTCVLNNKHWDHLKKMSRWVEKVLTDLLPMGFLVGQQDEKSSEGRKKGVCLRVCVLPRCPRGVFFHKKTIIKEFLMGQGWTKGVLEGKGNLSPPST